VATFVLIAIALLVACLILFGGFLVISLAIRKEDSSGTITGRAPSLRCRSARHMAGWHRTHWV
jgi:hypothetical protein